MGEARDGTAPAAEVCRLVSAELAPGECFELYRDSSRDLYDVFAADVAPEDMRMRIVDRHAGGLALSEFSASVHGVRRTAAHLRRGPMESLRLRFYRGGCTQAVLRETPVTMRAGAIHVVDYSCESAALSHDVDQVSFFLPHAAIGYDPALHPPYWRIDPGSPTGRLIVAAAGAVFARAGTMPLEDIRRRTDEIGSLVGSTLPDRPSLAEGRGVRALRAEAMKAHLDRRLRDPDLGIGTVAAAFGASRATIFRDFASEGGVASYIMRRRLEKAYLDLADQRPGRGAVARAADRWRFSSPSHMSRLFLERFGCRPGELVGLRAAGREED